MGRGETVTATSPGRWFFRNANLFDGLGPAVPGSQVVVEGEQIVAVVTDFHTFDDAA